MLNRHVDEFMKKCPDLIKLDRLYFKTVIYENDAFYDHLSNSNL